LATSFAERRAARVARGGRQQAVRLASLPREDLNPQTQFSDSA